MRRGSTVEALYEDALALAERGRTLEQDPAGRAAARQCFDDAVRIFSRLAIVESAAKRALVQDVIADLRGRIALLEELPVPAEAPLSPPSLPSPLPADKVDEEEEEEEALTVDAMLSKAMEIHARAREAEEHGDRQRCIELYLSAGDWYMKAYAVLGPEAKATKDAVREQIEYVIDHVSKLKSVNVTATAALPAVSLGEMDWPAPPEISDSVSLPDAAAWPAPPLDTTSALQSSASQSSLSSTTTTASGYADPETSGGIAWPLPPGTDPALDAFAWPTPPVAHHHSKRRSIRQSTPSSRTSSSDQLLGPPAATRQSSSSSLSSARVADDEAAVSYSPAELDVLRRSSQINGHIFVPWLDDLDSHENFRSVNLFVDPDGMVPLSAKQIRKGAVWMRPDEYGQLCAQVPVMIDSICPQVVKQDVVTDCSFVASLCIAAAYEQRFQKRLITNIIYPVDARSRQPTYNPSGKYIVKLWANGVQRKIVIDDFLPVNTQTRELLCSCTTRRNELWVSLIEKAYLKLHGGYDYPGGNSGIDLFALTGWIPERIAISDLAEDPAREDRIWEQLKSAFGFGDCIITMTTGDIGREEAIGIGLVPMHVYAVLNVYETTVVDDETGETKKLRLLHVKNPWRKLSWRGPYSNSDEKTWQGTVGDELREYQSQYYSLGDTRRQAESGDDVGLFWIDLESVKKHYESLYLNWNPELFPHKYVIHEHWPVELGPSNDSTTLAYNPQYSLRFIRRRSESVTTANARAHATRSSSTVWVLLTRHVSTVDRDADTSMQQFLTLHVYRGTEGRRVYYNQDAMHRGTYSNNPHTLLSLDVDFTDDEPEPSFTLVASQYEKFAPLDYTLSVFSTTPFVCRPVPHIDSVPNAVVVDNEWSEANAGGRPFFSTFMNNPQYHVQLNPEILSTLRVFLETASENGAECSGVPVNLRVITHSRSRACGLPALSADSPQRILTSGEYRPAFCYVEVDNNDESAVAGASDFVLIPSTFEAHTMAKFRLRIVSDPPTAITHVRELPMEGFGMVNTTVTGKWDTQQGSAAGCASYGCYTFNPKYLLRVPEESVVFARLIPTRAATRAAAGDGSGSASLPSCNLSIYASTSDGALLLSTNPKAAFRRATSDDGAYASGNPSGVATPHGIAFPAGWYVIIPSTYDPQEAEFELRVYSTKRMTLRHLEV